MRNSNKGVRGAVSVFLVMILVPCIVVSSVFVDLGRVHMSKSMAVSASDLALNTLLTNYDADLNEWYGMVASCQNIDDFYEVSAQFFLRTISSQGLSDEEIILLADYYSNATNDDTIYDLLQVECQTAPSAMVGPVQDANLSNPTFIKDQIVEFMKYRAPIEISTGLFSMFMDENGNKNDQATNLLESDKNDELVEAKGDFYESEGELLKTAYKSYWAIRDYYDNAKSVSLNNAKLLEYVNTINRIKTIYAYVHNASVKNLSNTGNLSVYSRVTVALDKYHSVYQPSSDLVHTRVETKNNVKTYYISGDRVDTLLTELEDAITGFEKNKSLFVDACKDLMNTITGTGDYDANPMQWWVRMDRALHGGQFNYTTLYKSSAETMLRAYSRVLSINGCIIEGENIPTDWEERYDELVNKVDSLHRLYLCANIDSDYDPYIKIVKKLEDFSILHMNDKDPRFVWVEVEGQKKTVDQWITYSHTELTTLKKFLQQRVIELDAVIEGRGLFIGPDYVPSLDELLRLASEYQTNLDEWTDIADNKETEMQKTDYEEINGLDLEREITPAAVRELKTRLVNIRDQLKTLVEAIDSMTYGNKKVVEISSFSIFKTQMNTKVKSDAIPLKNKDIDTYAGNIFGQMFKPTTTVVSLSNTDKNAYNPDINPEDNGEVDTPELFKYMHKKFKVTDREKFEDAEDDEEKSKSQQEDYEKDKKSKASEYRGKGTNIPIEFSSSDSSFSAGTEFIGSITGLVEDILDGNFDGIRDDIYVTTYITNMFSYATYDREIMYSLLSDEQKKTFSPSNAGAYDLPEIVGAADKEKTFLSEFKTDAYNKSLTNKMITKANNAAYLAEIEFILYGQDTNSANVKEAFNDIYAIRLVLNTVSAFQHFWSGNDTVNIIAGAISSMFGGVVPVPVIKAVMMPILAAIETCSDNSRLSYGMPVELYKASADDWWMAPPDLTEFSGGYSNFFSLLTEGTGKKDNKDKGLFYSDYLMFFVYIGLSNDGDLEANMYKRVAEVIQTNIGKLIKDSKGEGNGAKSGENGEGETKYSLKNSIVYFEITATLRVKPLMITLPIFNDYSNNMTTKTDWCTYTIKTTRGYS